MRIAKYTMAILRPLNFVGSEFFIGGQENVEPCFFADLQQLAVANPDPILLRIASATM